MGKNKKNKPILPFISICTPTFNRRPFYEMTIECFNHQTYPKNRMEWIILDDGTDKIEDLVKHIPEVKYFKYDQKMTLGKKRNLMHEKTTGDIIIYMDDDDYYPPERVSHVVEMFAKNPTYLVAGSSEMHIYFKDLNKMYQFGPYSPNHATAATFAFKKEYLKKRQYDENSLIAEEKHFLNNYQEPLIQLDTTKTILVYSHIHNSLDKKVLLPKENENNPYVKISDKKFDDFVKEDNIKDFLFNRLQQLLINYEPGELKNKPDVMEEVKNVLRRKQLHEEEHKRKMLEMQQNPVIRNYEFKFQEQQKFIEQLLNENKRMKEDLEYYKSKINILIKDKINEKTNERNK